MTAPTWADRSRPVAERVELAMLDFSMDDATEAYRRELVADVAAAARLARATVAASDAADLANRHGPAFEAMAAASLRAHSEYLAADNAFRARMQGVSGG
jgi:hypothetical protein